MQTHASCRGSRKNINFPSHDYYNIFATRLQHFITALNFFCDAKNIKACFSFFSALCGCVGAFPSSPLKHPLCNSSVTQGRVNLQRLHEPGNVKPHLPASTSNRGRTECRKLTEINFLAAGWTLGHLEVVFFVKD